MNKSEVFWKAHCKTKPNGKEFFSKEFKELVTSMLALDPNQRPNMEEVMNSDWVTGHVPNGKEILNELEQRN
jgi:serine/threonine protein kinase